MKVKKDDILKWPVGTYSVPCVAPEPPKMDETLNKAIDYYLYSLQKVQKEVAN